MIGGVLAGALTMIALQVFSSGHGPERGGALMQWVSGGVQQLLAADKAAIPNLSKSGGPLQRKGAPAMPSPSSGSGKGTEASLPKNPPLISA